MTNVAYDDGAFGLTVSEQPEAFTPAAVESELLTVEEVAAMLSIGVRSVWRKSQDGRLPPPIKMTGSTRWSKSAMREWIVEKASAAQKQLHARRRA